MFFSPDSVWLGFYDSRTRALKKMAIGGGPPVTIAPVPAVNAASWGDDDAIVFAEATASGGLFRVSAAGGGTSEKLIAPESDKGETELRTPAILPGSRAILFAAFHGADVRVADVAVLDLRTGARKTLIQGGFAPSYLPSGHLLFARQNTLLAVPFDPDRLEVRGTPMPVAEGIGTKPNGAPNFAVSDNGTLVYAPGGAGALKGRPVWVGRDGRDLGSLTTADLDNPSFPRISPDGRRLALNVGGDLWVYDLDGRPPIKLSFGGASFTPLWSPDGQRIVYESSNGTLASVPADGSTSTPDVGRPPDIFIPPDGSRAATWWQPRSARRPSRTSSGLHRTRSRTCSRSSAPRRRKGTRGCRCLRTANGSPIPAT